MGFFADLKEAVIETAENRPETAAKLAWGAGVTIFCVSNWLAVSKLTKGFKHCVNYVAAQAINEEQHVYNTMGKLNYICEKLDLDKEAMEEAGKQMARNHFYNELKLTDEVAVKLENILDIGPRLL
jgi:hypothetical protein